MCPESNLCLRLSSGVLLHPGVIHQTFLPAALLVMVGINILCLHDHKITIILLLMHTLWKSNHTTGFLHMDVMHIQLALLLPQGINTYNMGLLKLVAINLSIMKT
jgi:hypothetical protein